MLARAWTLLWKEFVFQQPCIQLLQSGARQWFGIDGTQNISWPVHSIIDTADRGGSFCLDVVNAHTLPTPQGNGTIRAKY
jgi:hypothetical protein